MNGWGPLKEEVENLLAGWKTYAAPVQPEIDVHPSNHARFATERAGWLKLQRCFAELETVLKKASDQPSEELVGLRKLAAEFNLPAFERMKSDLATVTRERDELAGERDRQMLRATKAESRHESCAQQVDSLTRELAEAREELRIHGVRETVLRNQYRGYLPDGDIAMLDALDAHRTKTSAPSVSMGLPTGGADFPTPPAIGWGDCRFEHCQHDAFSVGCVVRVEPEKAHRAKTSVLPSANVDIPHGNPIVGPENKPDYETASRLTKGVRYRVVEVRWKFGSGNGDSRMVGREFVDDGFSPSCGDGWYTTGTIFDYRVVRVEPEKAEDIPSPDAIERDLAGRHARAVFGGGGGGERSGKVGSRLAGPCPVIEPAPRMTTLEEIARAGQPEAKVDSCLSCGGWGETRAEPSSEFPLVRCPACNGTGKESAAAMPRKPLLGHRAGTVADLARRLDRVEQMLILKDDCAYVDIAEEIRAERAWRKSDG